jgi:dGTPase
METVGEAGTGRAPWASNPATGRGRAIAEPADRERTAFQRDRDRIVHATAFRRLQYKTQVFVYHEIDHYRSRLTHSLEVAQIARSIARSLRLDEDLAEAVALAHDLGHTPFGHAGEDALAAAMAPYGGFDHNEHALRVLVRLERRYAGFDGLNLTWETLEGLVKHNGPVADPRPEIASCDAALDLQLDRWPGLEAQVASLADDIAYVNHDIDDGLRAGFFTLDDLAALPLVGPTLVEVGARFGQIEQPRRINEVVRRVMTAMVTDLLATTRATLTAGGFLDADAVRAAGGPVARFGADMSRDVGHLRAFLFERMYRHWRVNRATSKARRVVADLFRLFMAEPEVLPGEWRHQAGTVIDAARARVVADYIAGMTDRFAIKEHARLFDPDMVP